MKLHANLRVIITLITFVIGLLFLENKRKQHKSAPDKTNKKVTDDTNNFNVSNTDFIFFQSLSKYLFNTMQN